MIAFNEAIKIDETNYKAYINISNIHLLEKNVNLCTQTLFAYLNQYGFEKNIANHLGKICINYSLQKELKKLILISEPNKGKNKNKEFILYLQGIIYEKEKYFIKAINSYKESISINLKFF